MNMHTVMKNQDHGSCKVLALQKGSKISQVNISSLIFMGLNSARRFDDASFAGVVFSEMKNVFSSVEN